MIRCQEVHLVVLYTPARCMYSECLSEVILYGTLHPTYHNHLLSCCAKSRVPLDRRGECTACAGTAAAVAVSAVPGGRRARRRGGNRFLGYRRAGPVNRVQGLDQREGRHHPTLGHNTPEGIARGNASKERNLAVQNQGREHGGRNAPIAVNFRSERDRKARGLAQMQVLPAGDPGPAAVGGHVLTEIMPKRKPCLSGGG